jgi:hypothetical protein
MWDERACQAGLAGERPKIAGLARLQMTLANPISASRPRAFSTDISPRFSLLNALRQNA